jgi:methionyl aminopeptidase
MGCSRHRPAPNDACWCGSGLKYKRCHRDADASEREGRSQGIRPGRLGPPRLVPPGIPKPDYALTGIPGEVSPPLVLDAEEISRMRRACRVAAEILAVVTARVQPDMTTDDIDGIAHEACLARGAYPSPLNYRGFPRSVCTSVNEVVCHGIPDSTPIHAGDIVKVDVTAFVEGMHGDCCATVIVGGSSDPDTTRLVRTAFECREKGIRAVRPGRPIADIGRAITEHARANRCDVVRSYGGHGIGSRFHNSLHVPHHEDPSAITSMSPGMTFTVEPMINLGTWQVRQWNDGWTVVTADGRRSAQFEHTVLVTEQGAEILTLP